MTKLISRPYTGEQDRTALLEIIRARPQERRDDFPGVVDIEEWTAEKEPSRKIMLWQTSAGAVAGYSVVDMNYNALWFETAPGVDDPKMAAAMIQWAEDEVRLVAKQKRDKTEASDPKAEKLSLRVSCRDDFVDRIFQLETSGYVADTGYSVHLFRSLDGPIPKAQLPTGYIIRALKDGEIEAAVALHRAAFGTDYMTVENRRSWMKTTDYEPALDLVAAAADGSLAAYCFCSISHADNALAGRKIGWTDPIATHPDHQRKGLAAALMSTGLQMLQERGMEEAGLGTWSENEAMWNAAEKVGFEVRAKTLFYYKQLVS